MRPGEWSMHPDKDGKGRELARIMKIGRFTNRWHTLGREADSVPSPLEGEG
jgi:hypothetical protein